MVRIFEEKDLNKVAELWLDTNIKAHNFIPAEYWQNHFEIVKEMFLQAEIYVYEKADRIQGFIGLDDNYIAGIFVCSTVQSKGIGKQLLDYVKAIKSKLSLNVYKKNVRAVQFYQREGFSILSENIDENTNEIEYLM
ncbi:MAG: GNAT family N-acetyltransferase, partial [Eubacterium sp.]|nr:GNAT family N-acetyltransferase [Eubacterium sp.]